MLGNDHAYSYSSHIHGPRFYLCGENTTVAHAPHTAAPSHVVGTHVTHGATCEDAWDQHAASAAMPQDVQSRVPARGAKANYFLLKLKTRADAPPFVSRSGEFLSWRRGQNIVCFRLFFMPQNMFQVMTSAASGCVCVLPASRARIPPYLVSRR